MEAEECQIKQEEDEDENERKNGEELVEDK